MCTKDIKRLKYCRIPKIRPEGWLKRQTEIQTEGLTGLLHQVQDCVESYFGWLRGAGENWERGSYYLDGLLSLTWYLKDEEYWELACRFVEWTLESTDASGNFGPVASGQDYWSRSVMLKVLTQYYEIKEDERVLKLFSSHFSHLQEEIFKRPMTQWFKVRIGDLLYCINWYCQQTGEVLKELAAELKSQTLDWNEVFEDFPLVRPAGYYYSRGRLLVHYQKSPMDEVMKYHTSHIVNLTMGLEYPATLSYFFDDRDYEEITDRGLEAAEHFHEVATGALNGDEHLAGNSPSRGARLCSVAEYMFSLQTMIEVFGRGDYGDKIEKLVHNALPVIVTEDFMAHQHLQQANQVLANRVEWDWFNINEESNMFGLELNFDYCTANIHQGWPKLPKSLRFKENEHTLVSMVHTPSSIVTQLAREKVHIIEEIEYPFKNRICYRVAEDEAPEAVLRVWILGWCSCIRVGQEGKQRRLGRGEGYVTVRGLKAGNEITVEFEVDICQSHWFKDSLAVECGPSVYALNIREQRKAVCKVAGVSGYEVYPIGSWNCAISKNAPLAVAENTMGRVPFSKQNPPVALTGTRKCLEGWCFEHNSVGLIPKSPVETQGKPEKIELVLYRCTKLRITQSPCYAE